MILPVFLVLLACLLNTSCASNESKAKAAVTEHLVGQGVTDIKVDLFCPDKNAPDRAYTSVTVTYNFMSSSGNPQHDYMGFILTRADKGWRVERNTSYTKEEQKAAVYLAGGK